MSTGSRATAAFWQPVSTKSESLLTHRSKGEHALPGKYEMGTCREIRRRACKAKEGIIQLYNDIGEAIAVHDFIVRLYSNR